MDKARVAPGRDLLGGPFGGWWVRHTEVRLARAGSSGDAVEGGHLFGRGREAGLPAVNFAEPAVFPCFGAVVVEVADDGQQAGPGAWIDAQAGAADTGSTE
ncbi:hypothetical protein GCM10010172_67190 [Paractinoplanes ferrugineus]|uniref:Uncharacterized protein n=1 Tax=Paractinoplanes ferrugineus TaxID=113564 RepID=A0A919J248_9ACTN|nr:hypothetical protein [Actinoplanes ferrugineus]GIE13120.1 hypothetical protein Afe05nite_49600 [Actinoplanes ferrugineus]